MIREEVLSKHTVGTFSGNYASSETRFIRILVPVDFSACSYNALEYALKLARACYGSIQLFHVIDAGRLPESDNAVVVQRALGRLEKQAAGRMEALQEMILESGVAVVASRMVTGHVAAAVAQQVSLTSPDLVVTGRRQVIGHTVAGMMRTVRCPLLMVPETAPPKVPASLILAADKKPIRGKALSLLFRIMHGTSRDLSVVNVCRTSIAAAAAFPRYKLPINGYDFRVHYHRQPHRHIPEGIDAYVKSNPADLLCTVQRKHFYLNRLFRRSISSAIAGKLQIPVLLLHDA